jgi:hypothetical protein
VGIGEESLEVQESGVEEGSECENLRGPKTPKIETTKFLNPKIFEGHKNYRGFNCWILMDKIPKVSKSQKIAEPSRAQKT